MAEAFLQRIFRIWVSEESEANFSLSNSLPSFVRIHFPALRPSNMSTWLQSLFEGCCCRPKPLPEVGKAVSATVTPASSPCEDLRCLPSLRGKLLGVETKFDGWKTTENQFFPYERKEEEDGGAGSTEEGSSASPTSPVDAASHILTQMKCAVCLSSSTGFCVGCSHHRYCYTCYHEVHSTQPGSHKFVSYARTKNVRTRLMLRPKKAE